MDFSRSNAASRPRDPQGRFTGKSQSAPSFDFTREATLASTAAGTEPNAAPPVRPIREGETAPEAPILPEGDGYVGWGTALWQGGPCLSARTAVEHHERATLYRNLGAPGMDVFEIFDRLTQLGEG